MNRVIPSESLTEELLRLYELALSTGQSVGPDDTSKRFLSVLMSRYNLTSASVWWMNPDAQGFYLLSSVPKVQSVTATRDVEKVILDLSIKLNPLVISPGSPGHAELSSCYNVTDQFFAVYPLSHNGVLVMSTAIEDLFQERLFNSLRPVLRTLESSIMGEIDHEKLVQSESELSHQKGFLKTLVQTLPDLVWLKDPDGVYLACNQRFEEFFGATEAEIVGKTDYDFLDPELVDFFREYDRKAMMKGAPSVNEEKITFASDGHEELLETTKTPMFDMDGKLIGVLGIGHNITEHRKSQEIIQQSELKFRSLVQTMSEGVALHEMVYDSQGHAIDYRILDVNTAFEQLIGIRADTAAGQLASELYDITPPPYLNEYTNVVSTGESLQFETYYPPLQRFFDISAFSPGPGQFATVFLDITERKQSEDALRASEKEFRQLVQNLQAGVVVHGPDSQILLANEQASIILGLSVEQMKGKVAIDPVWNFVREDGTVMPLEEYPVQRVLDTHQPIRGLMIGVDHPARKDRVWVLVSAFPELDADGQLLHAIITFTDITAQKLADQNLRKLSQAVEQSPESIVITNLDTEIEYVNEAFIKAAGYSREEAIGQNPRILNSGKTLQKTYTEMWGKLTQGESWSGEFINQRKDGSEYIEFAIISPLRQPGGSITHYVAVKEDITEKKRLVKELEDHRHHLEDLVEIRTRALAIARQQADAANEAKSAFIANTSHEIRTPMNAIIGMTHLALNTELDDVQANYISKAHSSANALLSLLNDILDLSKIEADKLELERVDFNIREVLNSNLSIIKTSAVERGISLSTDIASDIPEHLLGDLSRLGQVLLNLLSNALKFSSEGDEVSVTVSLQEKNEQDYVLNFSVKDTGIGISSKEQKKLFQPFSQADSSTTRKYGGTGLGLIISKKIVEAMGGEIGIESEPGVGSNFHFFVRLDKQLEDSKTEKGLSRKAVIDVADAREKLKGARLLLVEDNEVNQELASIILSMNGIDTEVASNGQEALKILARESFDGVLMDCQMPVMDGYEATRRIRAQEQFRDLPVIAQTANAMKGDKEKTLDAGMNDNITKPITPDAMLITLAKWIKPVRNGSNQ
ncbi:hypothetical protein BOW11_11260 [Solemya velum gill symbiont]|uniref:PAS domain-containing hybrid sensor histidine kinase/response regulator n=2 Tax=Solemya velum gill symbiont TaxID=2340 RepID=UPI0009977FA1|nr:PAS domain S-box protein [Solemya velum gill symbiont]OOY54708.1 hypothetical protein BOV99_10065 [Solemya velum gill symbiont]OOY55353.1 hypothetical protein BOW00_10070 [Solemya velum gill symbiont]OOY78447.1 hypothetical protein BOW11_11260 [Solemya velum gill symbiont]OOY93642.1 hypothetical protein BOW17_09655 [Solemya velum gill symbiont]